VTSHGGELDLADAGLDRGPWHLMAGQPYLIRRILPPFARLTKL
jgi:hypothetical protein